MQRIRDTIAALMGRSRSYEQEVFKPHPVLGDHQDVKSYFTSSHKMRLDERADWIGCPPELRQLAEKIQKRMRAMYIPVYVHTCYRSPQLQAELQQRGFSEVAMGAHQRSAAVDIVHNHFHWNAKREFWDLLGRVAKEEADKLTIRRIDDPAKHQKLSINWGGDWKSLYDPAHIELANWRDFPVVIGEGYRHGN